MYQEEIDFEVVPMTKTELAQLYAPELTSHSAVNRLMRWVNHHPVLREELQRAGYRKCSHLLSARMVALIIEYLGEP